MKLKDKQALINQKPEALKIELNKLLVERSKVRLDLKMNKIKDTSSLKKLRYKIALLKTIIKPSL